MTEKRLPNGSKAYGPREPDKLTTGRQGLTGAQSDQADLLLRMTEGSTSFRPAARPSPRTALWLSRALRRQPDSHVCSWRSHLQHCGQVAPEVCRRLRKGSLGFGELFGYYSVLHDPIGLGIGGPALVGIQCCTPSTPFGVWPLSAGQHVASESRSPPSHPLKSFRTLPAACTLENLSPITVPSMQ